ncbi:MAG: hypothetical protein DRO90_03120 [Candidatus Altiarchaeales archaeon]|nr:MAG: hypothetical protein DRO90_03120 [Candidatus Altiarchaeales archaeon]
MNYLKPLLLTILIYLIVQGLGLWISHGGFGVKEGVVEKVERGEIQPVVQNPERVESSIQIFLYIIIVTIMLLFLLRYKFELIIKIFVGMAFLLGLSFTFWNLLGDIGILVAVLLLVIGIWQRKNLLVMNIILIFTVPGIGSWLGASLSLIPALVLLIILSIYDIISVFGTKHMVKLADGVKGKMPLMFTIPVEKRILGLGTGDLALPVVFSTSIIKSNYSLMNSVFAVIGGLIGLIFLFIYITKRRDITLPALPPIAAGMILGFCVSIFIYI